MPIQLSANSATILIRRAAFESSGLARADVDQLFNLTADEFRMEEQLIVIGPLSDPDSVSSMVDALEARGLTYFEDFFDLSGNWPGWLQLFAMSRPR